MWLLENAGNAFQGRQLWLRPGQRYLFGRTRAEPGQLVISDKTISRKHLTITVDRVRDGDGQDPDARSVVTMEDLATKIGTVVNGTQIRGQKFVLVQDANTIKMGHMPDLFRITWHPVVLSFSLSPRELRAAAAAGEPDPWQALRRDLEPLDIKFLSEFSRARTTHVVAKKRNTSKGLQALINGSYIVTEAFIAAIVAAVPNLENDFQAAWPNPLDYLPPRGDEPSDRPVSTYGPDARRASLFAGYTFVFYDEKQYHTLLPPITDARGKALLKPVVPGVTDVDELVRYVKEVAGEPGLGELEDGGDAGRGVVVVRHVPARGDHVEWFTRFTTAVALRLDHRPVDQREFLDAVLAVEPGMLRRPLEVAAAPRPPPRQAQVVPNADDDADAGPPPPSQSYYSLSQASTAKRARARRGGTASRFKGFDIDLDSGDDDNNDNNDVKDKDNENMFMSQTPAAEAVPQDRGASQTRRNKRHPPDEEEEEENAAVHGAGDVPDSIMDDIAPTAALVKRRRIEAGIDPVPARPAVPLDDEDDVIDDDDVSEVEEKKKKEEEKPKIKKETKKNKLDDASAILEQARRNREAADEKRRIKEEHERLAALDAPDDDGIDAAAIRKLTLVDTIPVRRPDAAAAPLRRTREQDIADGRWDPRWNGRRNFKKFRKQGDVVGRAPQRVIVGLAPAKTKEYGIGDDYWLEGGEEEEEEGTWRGVARGSATARSRTPTTRVNATPDLDDDDSMAGAHDDREPSEPVVVPASAPVPNRSATGPLRRPTPRTGASGATPVPVSVAASGSGSVPRSTDSLGSGAVNLEIVADTDPEDDDRHDDAASPSPSLSVDLPRTRAGKVGTRSTRQSQLAAPATTRASRSGRGALPASGDTSSSVLDSVPSSSTQLSDVMRATRTRGKRAAAAAPAAAARLQSPAKRPRRGLAAAAAAASGDTDSTLAAGSAAPVTISDSDDDDGLRFKFKSRR